jgi:hypothetical protein
MNSKEVDTGDAAIYTVTIKGTGNLPVINAPAINWPRDMESYDVNSKENIDKAVAPLGGAKTFAYSFVATKPGKYNLPPVQMSYFDPASRLYKSTESGPVQIQVNQVKGTKKTVAAPAIAKTDHPNWIRYTLWSAAFLAILIVTLFIFKESRKDAALKEEKAKEIAALEKMAAAEVKTDPLQEARAFRLSGDFGKFYGSVNRSIWKGVSDTLNLPASELNKLNMATGLRTRGWKEDEIIQLKNILNECEMKLYTPAYSAVDVERVLGEAESITSRLNA